MSTFACVWIGRDWIGCDLALGSIRVGNLLFGCANCSFFDKKEQITLSIFLKERITLFILFVKSDDSDLLLLLFKWKSKERKSHKSYKSKRAKSERAKSERAKSKRAKEQKSIFLTLGSIAFVLLLYSTKYRELQTWLPSMSTASTGQLSPLPPLVTFSFYTVSLITVHTLWKKL